MVRTTMWRPSLLGKQWRLWNLWSWRTARRQDRRRISLAGQFLVLQLTVLLPCWRVSSVVSVRADRRRLPRHPRGPAARGRREPRRHVRCVRSGLAGETTRHSRSRRTPTRTQTDSTSPARSTSRGRTGRRGRDRPERASESGSTSTESTVQDGRSWTGDVDDRGGPLDRRARARDLRQRAGLIGIAMVAETYPSLVRPRPAGGARPAVLPRPRAGCSAWPARGCWPG